MKYFVSSLELNNEAIFHAWEGSTGSRPKGSKTIGIVSTLTPKFLSPKGTLKTGSKTLCEKLKRFSDRWGNCTKVSQCGKVWQDQDSYFNAADELANRLAKRR